MPPVAGRSVEELARREGKDPVEILRLELESYKAMKEAEGRIEAQDRRRALLSELAVVNRKLGLPSRCTCPGHPQKTE